MVEVIEKKKPAPRNRAAAKKTVDKSKTVEKTKPTQLVVLENLKPVPFFTKGDDVDDILEKIKADALLHIPDLSTGKGRAAITANISRVTDSKTYLEAEGKALAVEYKSIPAKIDKNRRKVKEFLAELQMELRKPLTDWEEDQAKIKEEKQAQLEADILAEKKENDHEIAVLLDEKFDRELAEAIAKELAAAKIESERLKQVKIDNDKRIAEEAAAKAKREAEQLAQQKINDAQAAKQKAIDDKIKADNDLIESQNKQRQLEAQVKQDRLNQEWLVYISEAYQINDQLNAQAEQSRQADLAEQNRLQSIEDERLAGIERQRVEQKRIDDETTAREADKNHRGSIHREILKVLIANDINEEAAKKIICLAAKGLLPKLTINY